MGKLLTILLVVGTIVSGTTATCRRQGISARGAFDEIINATINKVVSLIPDPLTISAINLDLTNHTVIFGGANVSDFKITGIHTFSAPQIEVNVLKLRLDMTFVIKEISLSTKYWADLLFAKLIPFYGQGRIGGTLNDIELKISGAANLTGGISIKDTQVLLSLGEAVIDLHGLLNNEEFSALISTVINDNLADFINENQDVISRLISGVVETIINAILKVGDTKSWHEHFDQFVSENC